MGTQTNAVERGLARWLQGICVDLRSSAASLLVPSASAREIHFRHAAVAGDWGALPLLSVVGTLGLLLVSLANAVSRGGAPWAIGLFWAGMLVLTAPIAARLAGAEASRRERIGLLLVIGLCLYLVKVVESPTAFQPHDEYAHWRTALDILGTGHLFQHNPLLPVTTYYPGLSSAAGALAQVGDISVVIAGKLVIAAARIVFTIALYTFLERVSGSGRVASVACLIYIGNPNYVFFLSHFSYESLALPLAALVLQVTARALSSGRGAWGRMLPAWLALGAVVVTHHLTSFALAAFLTLWALVDFCLRRRILARWLPQPAPAESHRLVLPLTAALAIAASVAWSLCVATSTAGYLTVTLQKGFTEFVNLLTRQGGGRQLFVSYDGDVAPMWERAVGIASVALLLLGLPFGLWRVWRGYRSRSGVMALAVVAAAYPMSPVLRFTNYGWEIANRSSEFLYVAAGLVVAMGVVELGLVRRPMWLWRLGVTAALSIIFLGGVIAGRPPWMRLAGPYIVGADARSTEAESIGAAEWMLTTLGPGQRVVADRTNRLLMATYGQQYPLTHFAEGVDVPGLIFSTQLGEAERSILAEGAVEYILADWRLTTALPLVGIYYEAGEPGTYYRKTPLDRAYLAKFEASRETDRILDSGNVVLYDVRDLAHVH